MTLRPPLARLAAALLLAAHVTGCPTGANVQDGAAPFKFTSFSPPVLIPGTKLLLDGEGFRANEPMKITFDGAVTADSGGAGGSLVFTLTPQIDSGERLWAEITPDLIDAAGGGGNFHGKLGLEIVRDGTTYQQSLTAELGLARELTPRLTKLSPSAVYFGDTMEIQGSGLLLGGHEGDTEIFAIGDFVGDDGETTHTAATGILLKTSISERSKAIYLHTPELLGLRTGEFDGKFKAINTHRDGTKIESELLEVAVIVLQSNIATVGPSAVSREQRIHVDGKGFFADKATATVTELRLHGKFKPRDGAATDLDLDLPARVNSSGAATFAIEPKVVDDQLSGFGAVPGTFTGDVTPIVQTASQELAGIKWTGSLDLLPTRQIVHLKFTPGFIEALKNYGLRNVEVHVKERLFEVVRRDYANYSVDFVDERPTEWEKWSTIELTGDDPNAADLFGLDNSSGKDVGNLRLNDYVGGTNAEQVEAGSYAFGGVFVSSFMRFSPNVCRKTDPDGNPYYLKCNGASSHPMATKRFDDFFAAFAPILGGTEAALSEWDSGARKDKLHEAVRVLGNLIGNTCTHEFGHSLGLAQETGLDEFHNPGDTPGWIMNPGGARPFAERAETTDTYNGITEPMGPAVWAPGDADYLEQILPKDE